MKHIYEAMELRKLDRMTINRDEPRTPVEPIFIEHLERMIAGEIAPSLEDVEPEIAYLQELVNELGEQCNITLQWEADTEEETGRFIFGLRFPDRENQSTIWDINPKGRTVTSVIQYADGDTYIEQICEQ